MKIDAHKRGVGDIDASMCLRLSKIMSQRELSAAKDYRVQEPAKFTKSALRGRGSPESRGSYHSAVRLGETATTPRNLNQ